MPALALSDHGNLFGAIEFYKECRKAGVKPIIGCEVYLAPGSRFERKANSAKEASTHFLLLAKNETGYKNLVKLVSAAHLEGMYYKPRIDKEMLAQHAEGLIGTSACLAGEVARHIMAGRAKDAEKSIDEFKKIFAPGDFYLEIADHGVPQQHVVAAELLKYGKQFGLKIVATNDVHYVRKEHAAAHDVLLCIQTGAKINDENRMRYHGPEFYLKTPEEMAALFQRSARGAGRNAGDRRQMQLEDRARRKQISRLRRAGGRDARGLSARALLRGPRERFGERAKEPTLRERLDFELGVLEKTGFTSYFLIVWDFIHYAKTHGIPVGPGRGSAAGSLISYVLEITDLDPLQVWAVLRALPQSRAHLAARYRRRLLLQPPARGDRVRAQKIWREVGRADHHLRHARREDGDSRRRARDGPELRRGRPADEDDPVRPEDDAGKGARRKPRFQARLRRGGNRAFAHRLGDDARGRLAPGGRARGGRGDFRPRPDRLRAADQGRPRRHRDAILDGAAGRTRPAEDGLSRPENADGDRGRAEADRADDRQKNDAARNSARRSRRVTN